MKNSTMLHTKAIKTHVISIFSMGSFHQSLFEGG
jgi:hypothetical protein